MKYRVIKGDDEIIIITEDGGVACIRVNMNGEYVSTTDYFQTRFTQEMLNEGDIWESTINEGKMYFKDWETPFDNPKHIADALEWLCPLCECYELDETIWEDFTKNVC